MMNGGLPVLTLLYENVFFRQYDFLNQQHLLQREITLVCSGRAKGRDDGCPATTAETAKTLWGLQSGTTGSWSHENPPLMTVIHHVN